MCICMAGPTTLALGILASPSVKSTGLSGDASCVTCDVAVSDPIALPRGLAITNTWPILGWCTYETGLCMPMEKWPGAPDAGNLHVRCDEGEGAVGETAPLYSTEDQSGFQSYPYNGWDTSPASFGLKELGQDFVRSF